MKNYVRYLIVFFLAFIIASLFISCDDNFSPHVDDNTYMVYCILDNRLKNQFAIMQKSYFYGVAEKMPKNTKLVLSEYEGKNYYFHDTLINGYENVSCFYLQNIELKKNIQYKLTSIADSLVTQYGELKFYSDPKLRYTDTVITENIYRRRLNEHLGGIVVGTRTREAGMFFYTKFSGLYGMVKIYIEYELKYGAKITKGLKEVPIAITAPPYFEYDDEDLPVKNYWASNYSDIKPTYFSMLSSNYEAPAKVIIRDYDEILYTLRFLNPHEIDSKAQSPDQVIIKRAFMVFYSVDEKLYDRAMKINADDYSIRLDESFYYTNLSTDSGKGLGYFGANAADTLQFRIRHDLIEKFNYKDEQK